LWIERTVEQEEWVGVSSAFSIKEKRKAKRAFPYPERKRKAAHDLLI